MKRILITGASGGIGRASAERLAAAGHQVWGTSRHPEHLPVQAGFHPLDLDLNEPQSLPAALTRVLGEAGGIDVLINNAGEAVHGSIEHMDPADIERQFQTLVFAPIELVRAVLPGMRAQGGGLIVNVSSLAAEYPLPFMAAYSAAKAALSSFSMSLQIELRGTAVKVVDLRLGDIHTDFNEHLSRTAGDQTSEYRSTLEQAFGVYDARMRSAPPPALVADAIAALVADPASAPYQRTVGSLFQARLAAYFGKLLPRSWVHYGIRRYYKLP